MCAVQVIMQRLARENADLTLEVQRLHEQRSDSDGEQLEELQAEVQRLRSENIQLRIASLPQGVSRLPSLNSLDELHACAAVA